MHTMLKLWTTTKKRFQGDDREKVADGNWQGCCIGVDVQLQEYLGSSTDSNHVIFLQSIAMYSNCSCIVIYVYSSKLHEYCSLV